MYKNYKHFNHQLFRNDLSGDLHDKNNTNINYEIFEEIILRLLNKRAPPKKRFARANNSLFMNIAFSKAIMTRSRLQNKLSRILAMRTKCNIPDIATTALGYSENKTKIYNNLDTKLVTDNRTFWNTIKPFFSDKHFGNNKITLLEGEVIISNDQQIAEIFNVYFANIVENLDIEGFVTYDYYYVPEQDYISNIVEKF